MFSVSDRNYGGREGSAAKAAAYNSAYAAAYHNQAAAKLRQVAATLHYGGRQCRIVAAAHLYHGGRQMFNSVPYEFLIKLNDRYNTNMQVCKRCRVFIASYGLNILAS